MPLGIRERIKGKLGAIVEEQKEKSEQRKREKAVERIAFREAYLEELPKAAAKQGRLKAREHMRKKSSGGSGLAGTLKGYASRWDADAVGKSLGGGSSGSGGMGGSGPNVSGLERALGGAPAIARKGKKNQLAHLWD